MDVIHVLLAGCGSHCSSGRGLRPSEARNQRSRRHGEQQRLQQGRRLLAVRALLLLSAVRQAKAAGCRRSRLGRCDGRCRQGALRPAAMPPDHLRPSPTRAALPDDGQGDLSGRLVRDGASLRAVRRRPRCLVLGKRQDHAPAPLAPCDCPRQREQRPVAGVLERCLVVLRLCSKSFVARRSPAGDEPRTDGQG